MACDAPPLAAAWAAALLALAVPPAAADGGFFDSVRFVQYLDEGTALEEVRNGNIDMYYYRMPPDRLEEAADREGLQVFGSSGGSYSILVNPAESDEFNPFSMREVRHALNYLVDRRLVVNELMGGHGHPSASYYGPADPEFLSIVDVLEGFGFAYNPALAEAVIARSMEAAGASREGGAWAVGSEPVTVRVFIRSDDPARRSIGELLSSELEGMGFAVERQFGDLNKALVVVYGSDPADLGWSLYTEGWARSAFVRYDSVGLGQMYAPWFSNMPGFNDPAYWNYSNDTLDSLTQRIYAGEFASEAEREGLVREAVAAGISESVRVFIASNTDWYVAAEGISGIVNDFGAGVPGRFTPINARGPGGDLAIGVKQIYQAAWNPVMGLTDTYGRDVWEIVSDPGTHRHPFTGSSMPVRSSWDVETAGPGGSLAVPEGAVAWDAAAQEWREVGPGVRATSAVTFDYEFGPWHNGEQMTLDDILYSLYFASEWGTQDGPGDMTFDAEFTPRAGPSVETFVGVLPVDGDTLRVFVDYWHFDDGEIAAWAGLWSSVPWEVTAAMEQAVLDGRASFSRSGATAKGISWLSLLVPNDAGVLRGYLEGFASEGHVPAAVAGAGAGGAQSRYEASASWIASRGHAVISNGPFYLESYSPESRSITVRAFGGYPLAADTWSEFSEPALPEILGVSMAPSVEPGAPLEAEVTTANADSIRYYLTDASGRLALSGSVPAAGGRSVIALGPDETASLGTGAAGIRIFATSESVLRPDMFESGFLVVPGASALPAVPAPPGAGGAEGGAPWHLLAVPAAAAAAAVPVYLRLRARP